MSSEPRVTKKYGVRFPNGEYDWNVSMSFGSIDTPKARADYQEQYKRRLVSLGAPSAEVEFVTQIETVTCTEPEVIVDKDPTSLEPDDDTTGELPAEDDS